MTEKEFKEKMKEYGYSEEDIQEIIEEREEQKRDLGDCLPYEAYLIELPIDY